MAKIAEFEVHSDSPILDFGLEKKRSNFFARLRTCFRVDSEILVTCWLGLEKIANQAIDKA